MQIISKKEAKELGLKRYFTGKPCKHGHITEFYVSGSCVECRKIKTAKDKDRKAAYDRARYVADPQKKLSANLKWAVNNRERKLKSMKAWHDKHRVRMRQYGKVWYAATKEKRKEKIKAANDRWRFANYARHREISKQWRLENPERSKETAKRWREANREAVRKRAADWLDKNRERRAATKRLWDLNHREKTKIYVLNRQARIRHNGGTLSYGLSDFLLQKQGGRCACPCRAILTKFHMDHIVPLSKGGVNIDSNIQLLTPRCNHTKSNKDNDIFMEQQRKKYEAAHANT